MSDLPKQLMTVVASRLADQIWAIRDTSLQAYIGSHASGVEKLDREDSATFKRSDSAIAVLRVDGVIVPDAEWYGEVSSLGIAGALQAAMRDDDIRAGVLMINSPGGVARGMLEVAAAAKEFAAEKPLVAHVSGCCCSAAYWLASQAEAIYAGPRDDVGSIGTRSLIYDYSKYFEEIGVEAVVSATGPLKALGIFGTSITEAQRAFLQARVDYVQKDFRDAVMSGRGFTEEEFALVATGAYWFGEQAVELKLIDGVQSSQQTFAGVASAFSDSPRETSVMADNATTEPAAPKAATTAELKKTFPNSTAEWREEQTESGATMADAAVAYAQFQEAEAEKARTERDEAKAEAEKAQKVKPKAKAEPAKSTRGASLPKGEPGADADATADTDYRALAQGYQEKHKCRWSEACLAVKRKYPEAVGAFGGPPVR